VVFEFNIKQGRKEARKEGSKEGRKEGRKEGIKQASKQASKCNEVTLVWGSLRLAICSVIA